MSIRCAVVCPIASGGGISEAFITSLHMLASNGFVPVAFVPKGFIFTARLCADGFEFHEIANLENGGALHLVKQTLRLAINIGKAKVQVIVLNNGRFVRGLKLLLPGLPMLAIYHGGKTARYLKTDRVVTINDEQAEYLKRHGYPADRIAVVDNAIPLDHLPDFTPKPRTAHGPVIGTLRLLEPAKGVDVLIDAVAILAKRGRRFTTRIGSTGSQEPKLRARVRQEGLDDLIEFSGWIDDKAAFFDSLDIYVLPSRAEEWGIGIVEANVARLPVIATACLGPRRIVKDQKTGILVPVEDPAAMADAIERLADNPDLCWRLASAGYAYCKEHFLFPKIAKMFSAQVERAIEDHASLRK